jgi:hypothetical protein
MPQDGASVVIVVEPGIADDLLRDRPGATAARAIRASAASHGARILPSPAPLRDENGGEYVTLSIADFAKAARLADALRPMEGVRSAYPKPGEALP